MNNNPTSDIDTSAETKNSSNKGCRQKGVAYPSISIEEAINAVRELKNKLGRGPYAREDIATALGHQSLSGPASRKISTCTQFGLFDRNGNAYELSQLALRIISPVDKTEKSAAIIEAVGRPRIYAELIAKYNSQALPQMLSNILIRQYKISDKAVEYAVSNFEKSLAFAGILKNGIIIAGHQEDSAGSVEDDVLQTAPTKPQDVVNDKPPVFAQEGITIDVPGTDISVIFPKKYAFSLATGAFSSSLNELKKSALEISEEGANDE